MSWGITVSEAESTFSALPREFSERSWLEADSSSWFPSVFYVIDFFLRNALLHALLYTLLHALLYALLHTLFQNVSAVIAHVCHHPLHVFGIILHGKYDFFKMIFGNLQNTTTFLSRSLAAEPRALKTVDKFT